MSSGFFEPNSYSAKLSCYYCGCVNKCTELNIIYKYSKIHNVEETPFIFCSKCNKYNSIDNQIPVIVKERILDRKRSFCKTCRNCSMIMYVDESEPYTKKWYNFNSSGWRSVTCKKCGGKGYIESELIPPILLKKLKYKDEHMSGEIKIKT